MWGPNQAGSHGWSFREGQLKGMSTTTKKDLIDRIAEETGQKRTAVKAMVQSFLDSVIRELGEGNRLEFRDFGVFEIRQRAPRMAQNPKTLERVPVPAKTTVKFKVGRLMKAALEREDNLPEEGGAQFGWKRDPEDEIESLGARRPPLRLTVTYDETVSRDEIEALIDDVNDALIGAGEEPLRRLIGPTTPTAQVENR